jgi:uncharacterized protein (DUF58 family)
LKVARKPQKPFIVPTLYGLAFFLLILDVFALGYYRYNAPFHTVGLTLIIFGLVAMIQTNNNLQGVSCDVTASEPGEEGGIARLSVVFKNSATAGRYNLFIEPERRFQSIEAPSLDELVQHASGALILRCPGRGIYPLGRLRLYSRGYYGLFYTWKWIPTTAELVVYPKPEGPLPLPQAREGLLGPWGAGEDFQGHRSYTPGLSLKHVDWKAFARGQDMLVKEFGAQNEGPIHLSLSETPGVDIESRLRQLSAWILACHQQNRRFSLEMPSVSLPENFGRDHMMAALRLLAAHQEGQG